MPIDVARLTKPARRVAEFAFRPPIFLSVAVIAYLAVSLLALQGNLHNAKGRADMVSGDSEHYIDIAKSFAAGDFTMAYVRARPHRQPLYPFLLAPIYRWGNGSLFAPATVNVGLAALTLVVIYFGTWKMTQRRWIAVVLCALYAFNEFIFAEATRHLLTEPLHVLLMLAVIFAVWRYLEGGRSAALFVAVAITGLDYLARPNGLFVLASLFVVLAAEDFRRWILASRERFSWREVLRKLAIYSGAVVIFAVVTMPSWIPRELYFGNPIHHGYLSNYLWVDTYQQGHVGQKFAIYGWRDYVRNHTFADAARRATWGIWRVGIAIPVQVEGKMPGLFVLALACVAVTLIRGPASFRILAAFGFVQLLPLMWTTLSNPTVRVPYASTLPFELLFAAAALSAAANSPFLGRVYFKAEARIQRVFPLDKRTRL